MNWIKSTHVSILAYAALKKGQQQFLWLIAFVLFLILCYGWYNNQFSYTLFLSSFSIVLLSFIYPKPIFPFLYVWMLLGKILSEITSTIVLVIIFFIGIVPLGFFYKKNQSSTKWKSSKGNSNFEEQF